MAKISAPSGLVHALELDGKGGVSTLTWDDSSWANGNNIWLHFDFEDPQATSWIQDESHLNELAIEELLSEDTRPNFLRRNDNLLLILRGVNLNEGAEPEDMVAVRIWTDGQRMISTRRRHLLSTQDVLAKLNEQEGPVSIGQLLVDWIEAIVGRMTNTVDALEDELLNNEQRLLDDDDQSLRTDLMKLRRRVISLKRYLTPQREALHRLESEPLTWLDDSDRLRLRSISDRQVRHVEDLDLVRERTAMALEELAARSAEQLNQRSYLLTIVAALFLPLGFFTGLMGINVGGMPGVENDQAFWWVSISCVGLTILMILYFRWKRWL
ncbi:zinc transporter ZntB [uncultured Umboniibacter sp.]|uniref:zinc transporter ZntB n=1 Tax=uncultured Umboniibacter sp. TaxID=1798917 RepID=UPI00262DB0A5|nr:zinc transporter ZntB [uncultured Umboniibacter sp.]